MVLSIKQQSPYNCLNRLHIFQSSGVLNESQPVVIEQKTIVKVEKPDAVDKSNASVSKEAKRPSHYETSKIRKSTNIRSHLWKS